MAIPQWIGAFVISGCAVGAAAQSTVLPARKVEIAGLPHRTIYALLEDSQGFLWIGTADGLARFDGYEVRVHRYDPFDPEGLSSSTVTALLEDRNGTLWVGTEMGSPVGNSKSSTGALDEGRRTAAIHKRRG